MAEDIKVTLSADIAQMVAGLNQATAKLQDAVKGMTGNLERLSSSSRDAEKATQGLTGSIQSGVRDYAVGAAAGLTVANAIEKVATWARESVKWIYDSGSAVNTLAEEFKDLRASTGESLNSLNEIYAATAQFEDNTKVVESLMVGWSRSVKTNSDTLIANGVAANQATLQGMSFKEYLLKVYEISQEMQTPAEANAFLMEALGKGGALAGPKLKELAEAMKEGNEVMETGNLITQDRINMQERDEQAVKTLKLSYEKTYAGIGDAVNRVLVPFKEVVGWFGKTKVAQDDVKAALEAGIITTNHWYDSLDSLRGKLAETLAGYEKITKSMERATMDNRNQGGGRSFVGAPDTKKPGGAKSSSKVEADNEVLSYNDVVEWSERYLQKRQETFDKDAKAAADYAAKLAREKAEYLNEESEKAVESQRKLAKDIQQTWEKTTVKGGIFAYIREARQALKEWGTYAKQAVQGVESAFSSSLKGMMTGQMTLSQGLTNLWRGVRDAVIGMIAEMLAKWLTSKLMEMILGKTAAASQAASGAALYAVNAMQSVAAIPFVGWAMAPGVGAAAYATGMGYAALASAAGGWDRVPSDQLAMIHKNEMVLPAHLAEGARETFKRGQSGGTTIINAVDARGVERVLRRNQGALIKLGNEAARNNRRRA